MATPKKRILIVDDDADWVESNRLLLESNGYEVLTACDGASGLARARKEHPDLMILDVMMATDTEGFEVSRKIPETPELRKMPILLVTGIRREKKLAFGFEPDPTWLPVTQVLEKPVEPKALLEEIKKRIG
jgi:two-component system, OmpR family, alkaline phosphatase synthesis response regulator PhoP